MDANMVDTISRIETKHPSPWPANLGLVAFLLCVIGAVFFADIANAVSVWYIYPAYSHCFLILPISAWLIWEKREQLAAEVPKPEPLALPIALLVALVWLAGYFSTTNEIRQIAVIGFVELAILGVLGWRIYRQILFPALFLFFLIPTGEYLIPPLQRVTAYFTDWGLTVFNVVHYREGTLFELANGRYSIAEACAGLRFLTATFTLGTLFCYLTFRKWWKIASFLAACIIIPIAANAVRVLATMMVANYTNNRVAAGMDHIVYGWGFAVAIMLVLLYAGSRIRDPEPSPVAQPPRPKVQPIQWRLGAAVVVALVALIGLGPAIAALRNSNHDIPNLASLGTSLSERGWTVLPLNGAWNPPLDKPSAQFAATLESARIGDSTVDIVVDDYAHPARNGSLIGMKSHLWNSGWEPSVSGSAAVPLGGRTVIVSENVIDSLFGQRLVWSCFWIDGSTTTSPVMVKLLQLGAAFSSHDGAAVLVASTPVEGTLQMARTRLRTVLASAGEPILDRLQAPSQSR